MYPLILVGILMVSTVWHFRMILLKCQYVFLHLIFVTTLSKFKHLTFFLDVNDIYYHSRLRLFLVYVKYMVAVVIDII